jgi:hypothetical protein
MASEITSSISYGSDKVARLRKKLYVQAAKEREGNNFSRLAMKAIDAYVGVDLPLPKIGRPKKIERQGSNDGFIRKKRSADIRL